MKVTYNGSQSLRTMLAERGVPTKDLGKAVDQIVKHNGLDSARSIPKGTVLDFPSTLTLGDAKVKLKKVVGDVASHAERDRPRATGGRAMGAMGIFAFADLQRGGAINACGPSTHPMSSGCAVSACSGGSTPTTRRRRTSSSVSSSGCGPSTQPMYSGCAVSACSGGSSATTRRRRTSSSVSSSGCGPSTHPMYSGCAVSACSGGSTSTTRRRRTSSDVVSSGCGPSTHPMYSGCAVSACSGGSSATTRRRRASSSGRSSSGCGVSSRRSGISGCG